tara:strand:+ start:8299 stop:11316 length:3018 start_codon:yes stop_codon:yes gene_type:complete
MNKVFYLFLCFFIYLNSFGQPNLFTPSHIEIPLLTSSEDSQIALSLNMEYFYSLKDVNPCEFYIDLPFFQDANLNLYLEAFNTYTNDFQLLRSAESGLIYDDYQPIIKSFRIKDSDGWTGSISLMKNYLIGVLKKNGNVYEIKYIDNNTYVLFDVNESIVESNFSCQTNDSDITLPTNTNQTDQMIGGAECLEMGIEIDYYTFTQFGDNCYDAVEWALALLAGVNEIYMSELNDIVTLEARYINVWEVIDNYDDLNDCGDMLDEMPNYWTNPPFDDIYQETDLVHLFSRKNANGGIAWVGALCGGQPNSIYGFGVTTGLNTSLTYDYPENTPYSYNLSYLGHEIGHNFGSQHTHNCNWNAEPSVGFPGGAIDACSDVEGDCDPPDDPPNEVWQQEIGTIMSYCDFSIGITLEFHPVVEIQALIPGVNSANCLTTCDDIETSCGNSIYGCTDPIAENYNSEANIDDNSCEYIYGCTSINADNYDANATMDDGSCICSGLITLFLETDYYSSEVEWELIDSTGLVIDSGGDYPNQGCLGEPCVDADYCLSEGCYEFNIYDSWGDGISSDNTAGNNPDFYILSIDGDSLVQMGDPDFGFESLNSFCLVICDADIDGDGVCDTDEVYGCTDLNYLEYNDLATEDDGSCLTLIIEGCTDSLACNYDSSNNFDDGSCTYAEEGYDCDGNCISDINNDEVCDLFGCMNSDACNYDANANIDDDNCEFPDINFDCDGNCVINIDCAGICGGDSVQDECGVCNGDNTICLGCTDSTACNYEDTALIDDGNCEYPDINFDCSGSCLVDIDCAGICGGSTIYDECGECGGNGPVEFYDCAGNCLLDTDFDGVCDQTDNCLEDFNPSQVDNDDDGYGDECSCQYIDIIGQLVVEAGSYEIYTLSMNINNMAAWQVDGGNIAWNSANEPSIGVQWLDPGVGTVSIIQYYGVNETCIIEFEVTVIPSSIDLSEHDISKNKIIVTTDVLGKNINNQNNNNQYIFYIYDDGSVEKVYQINQ